jgi:tRNA(adenine34) deaminase
MKQDNEYWMKQALIQADKAFQLKEVPVGAIIVKDNKVIGRGYNQKEQLNDPTGTSFNWKALSA